MQGFAPKPNERENRRSPGEKCGLTPGQVPAGNGPGDGQFLAGTAKTHVRTARFLELGLKKIPQYISLLLQVFPVLCCACYRYVSFLPQVQLNFFFFETCLLQFMFILVFKDALESLKLDSKPPFPEHPVGRQPACLWDGRVIQASHSLDQFSQDRKANQLLEILCLMGKWSWRQPLKTGGALSAVAGPWGSLASLCCSRSPMGATEEGLSTSQTPREMHTDTTHFLTTPGAPHCLRAGAAHHTLIALCRNPQNCSLKSHECLTCTGKST